MVLLVLLIFPAMNRKTTKPKTKDNKIPLKNSFFSFFNFFRRDISLYYIIKAKSLPFFLGIFVVVIALLAIFSIFNRDKQTVKILASETKKENYWFLLHRKSNIEYLYKGQPNDIENSNLIKTFKVKVGVPGQKPTPLPNLLGREYWKIIDKFETKDKLWKYFR